MLSPGIDLAAYRVLQEALTNVMKHSDATLVDITVRYRPKHIELAVADDGRVPSAEAGGGYGLVGMRERLALYGGSLEAGPTAEGGFRVEARLPTRDGGIE